MPENKKNSEKKNPKESPEVIQEQNEVKSNEAVFVNNENLDALENLKNGTEEANNPIGEALEEASSFKETLPTSERDYYKRIIASKNETIEKHKATVRELEEKLIEKQAPVSED